ncbi:MAG: GlsB/YeaQ/YmgE family stress response membrane protein [Bacteroidales bacterium]|nr:GlsB/YeaQ/YmgE family stress response membrane protein [Bacteroidales bacterium]
MIYSLLLGLLAGYIASKLQSGKSNGIIINMFLGVIGSAVGGWLFSFLGIHTYSIIGEIVCASRCSNSTLAIW